MFRNFIRMGIWVGIVAGVLVGVPAEAQTKHVILLIADGAGYNTFNATSMYQGKWDEARGRSTQVYDGPGWVQFGCSTYPLNTGKTPTGRGTQDSALVYAPQKAWDPAAGYRWLMDTYTDSAAAATAISTGQKTYNSALNWSDTGQPIKPTLAELAKQSGRSVGVVTTVQWSHATPAGLSQAHHPERDEYQSIAQQMLAGPTLDVLIGAGNPDFDNDGQPKKKKEYKYVGGQETWQAIEQARQTPNGTWRGFRPVSTKAEFEALVSGPAPARILGTVQVGNTLQQARRKGNTADPALDTPLNPNLPDLPLLVKAALNVVDDNPQGFFLMIEGGAVDWANHDNQAGRMIQEQIDFNATVQTVVAWIEAHSNWEESLVVVTSDHDNGLIGGPQSDVQPFQPIVNRGPGQVPGMKYNSKNHTNALVPLYARGAGSEKLSGLVRGQDPVRGAYVDNTDVAKTLQTALTGN